MIIFILFIIIIVILAIFTKHKSLFRPCKSIVSRPRHCHDVYLKTPDGETLHGWLLYPGKPSAILFCHGNAGNISTNVHLFEKFKNHSIFLFDYRGYGKSTGTPSETGLHIDAMTAWNYMIKTWKPNHVSIFGHSLGGCIATHLAQHVHPKCLIVQSSFTHPIELFPSWMQWAGFVVQEFPHLDFIKNIKVPTLIIHSKDDYIIPISHGKRLYHHVNHDKKHFIEIDGGHSIFKVDSNYIKHIDDFIKKY